MTTVGRKRSFDKEEVLDKAMRVFWDNGFAGTSMSDLTEAIGINKPSLYATFGNKEQLFNAVMAHYINIYGAPSMKHLTEPADLPLLKRLENYMFAIVATITAEASPKGCFVVKSCCESGGLSLPEDTTASLVAISEDMEQILEEFLLNEQLKGQLSKAHEAKDIAAYLLSLLYGLSVMARRGKSAEALQSIVKTTLKTLPA